jgi:transcriptional antiterminator RfaH
MNQDKSRKWLVVMTKPRTEDKAVVNLERQGFETYLPFWSETKRVKGVWKPVKAPMFPRYLFLSSKHEEQSFAAVRSTHGVSRLVQFGNKAAWVTDGLLESIRQLEQYQGSEGKLVPFKKGDAVEVLVGPFKGVSADVLACDQERVILLLKLLGQVQKLEVEVGACRHAL